jgi:hypothetical protein
MSSGVPVQTWFYGPTVFQSWAWMVEASGYEPSPQETLVAPFYPDPSQRILAMSLDTQDGYSVMKVETFLRLARERAGGRVQWREWSPHLILAYAKRRPLTLTYIRSWVSGSRFFRISNPGGRSTFHFNVYDFSPLGRTKHFWRGGGTHKVMHRCAKRIHLPCLGNEIIRDASFGHDSVISQIVSIFFRLRDSWELSEALIHVLI